MQKLNFRIKESQNFKIASISFNRENNSASTRLIDELVSI